MTGSEAFALVARAQFEAFSELDFDAFSGVQSDNPQIATIDDLILVLDGNVLSVVTPDEEFVFILAGL